MIKVAIADDHKIFRDGIKMALSGKEYLKIIWEAEDGKVTEVSLSSMPRQMAFNKTKKCHIIQAIRTLQYKKLKNKQIFLQYIFFANLRMVRRSVYTLVKLLTRS